MRSTILPLAALQLLRETDPERIVDAAVKDKVPKQRATLLAQILRGDVVAVERVALDIRLYALKLLYPEMFRDLGLENHVYSQGELYEYDPPKNGLNVLKHGFSFDEVFLGSSRFGTLMVPCPDPIDGTPLWSNLSGHLNRWKIHHLRSMTWQNTEKRSTPA